MGLTYPSPLCLKRRDVCSSLSSFSLAHFALHCLNQHSVHTVANSTNTFPTHQPLHRFFPLCAWLKFVIPVTPYRRVQLTPILCIPRSKGGFASFSPELYLEWNNFFNFKSKLTFFKIHVKHICLLGWTSHLSFNNNYVMWHWTHRACGYMSPWPSVIYSICKVISLLLKQDITKQKTFSCPLDFLVTPELLSFQAWPQFKSQTSQSGTMSRSSISIHSQWHSFPRPPCCLLWKVAYLRGDS